MLPRNAAAHGPWRSTSLESRAGHIDHPADNPDGASGAFAATPRRKSNSTEINSNSSSGWGDPCGIRTRDLHLERVVD
jgi:hypothetical protein